MQQQYQSGSQVLCLVFGVDIWDVADFINILDHLRCNTALSMRAADTGLLAEKLL